MASQVYLHQICHHHFISNEIKIKSWQRWCDYTLLVMSKLKKSYHINYNWLVEATIIKKYGLRLKKSNVEITINLLLKCFIFFNIA